MINFLLGVIFSRCFFTHYSKEKRGGGITVRFEIFFLDVEALRPSEKLIFSYFRILQKQKKNLLMFISWEFGEFWSKGSVTTVFKKWFWREGDHLLGVGKSVSLLYFNLILPFILFVVKKTIFGCYFLKFWRITNENCFVEREIYQRFTVWIHGPARLLSCEIIFFCSHVSLFLQK